MGLAQDMLGYMMARWNTRVLPSAERFKFVRHQFYAAFGYRRRVPLDLREVDGYYKFSTPEGSMYCPYPERWKFYRRGLAGRLRMLDLSYQFTALDPPPGPVLDIGAYIGEFSLLALSRGRAVYSVEPDPDALACLRRNVAGRGAIAVIDAVIWNTEEELTFGLDAAHADSSVFIADIHGKASSTLRRHATTLDRIAENHKIDSLAFLKIEAEGAEPEVLEGGRNLLQRTARVAVDTGPERRGRTTSAACETLLRDAGFTVRTSQYGRVVTYGTRAIGLPPLRK